MKTIAIHFAIHVCGITTTFHVVVMPQTILPQRNRCALSATDTRKPEKKDARGVTCFMEENVISPCEVARFNEHISLRWKKKRSILLMSDW